MSYVTLMGGKAGSSSFKTKPDTLRSDDSFEMLLGLGSGRWKGLTNGLKSLYINNVPLENEDNTTNFKDFAVFFADGDPSQEQLVNFKLGGGGGTTQVGTSIGNNTGSVGPWVTAAVTTPNADFIDLRFVVSALYYQDKKGIRENTMNLQVEMRPSGTSQWINPLASNEAPEYNQDGYYVDAFGVKLLLNRGFWDSLGNQWNDPSPGVLAITGKTTSPFVKELRIAVPNTGVYANKTWEVRVRLNDPELVQNDPIEERRTVQWESVAAVSKQVFGSDEAWRGLAWLQVVGKASDQLSGVPSLRGIYQTKIVKTPNSAVFNPATRTYTGEIWDGSYSLNYTDDPAWCLKDLIEDPISGISAISPGSVLDRWDALEVSKYCSEQVSDGRGGTHPRFSMNLKIDQAQNAQDLIQYIAGAVNSIAWDSGDGVWRMKQDKPESPVALFTRDNIVGEFTYQHTDVDTRYNDYTVTFLNKENNYTEDRARVYDQADIDAYGRKPTTVVAVGANNRQEALRRAMFRLRVSLNENKIVNFVTNRQGMLLRPLDVILVADTDLGYVGTPTASDNRTTTRLVGRSGTTLNLGSSVRLENGVSYLVAFTYPNPNYDPESEVQPSSPDWQKPTVTISRTVTNSASQRGDVDTLYIDSPIPDNVAENAVVALAAANLPSLPRQYRVLDVTPQDDEFVSISALIVDTGKYNAADNVDESAILGQVSNQTVPPPEAPADGMFEIRTYEGELGPQRVLGVSWLRPGSLFLSGFKVEYSVNDGPWVVFKENIRDTYVELLNPTNGKYTFRITSLDRRGRSSTPLIGVITLDETSGAVPPHNFGPLADRPLTGVQGERYTTTDQVPNVTYVWMDGGWVLESTIVKNADDIYYGGGPEKVGDLKPAEPGATNGMNPAERDDFLLTKQAVAAAQAKINEIESSVEFDFSEINNAVDQLESSVTVVQTNITNLQSATSAVQQSVGTLQQDVSSAQQTIGSIQVDVSGVESNVSSLQSFQSSASLNLSSLNSSVSTLQGQASSAASSISALQSQAASLQSSVGTINTDLASAVGRITTAEGEVDTLQTLTATQGGLISTNATAISNVAGDLSSLTTRVSSGRVNLLEFGSFELGAVGWPTRAPGWSFDYNFDWGTIALLGSPVNGTYVLGSDLFPVSAGSSYTISADTVLFASGGEVYVDLIYYDAQGNILLDGGQNARGPNHNFSNDLSARGLVAHTSTAPAGAAQAKARFVAQNLVSCTYAGVRQIKVENGTTWSAYSDEATVYNRALAIQTAEGQIASLTTRVGTAESSVTTNATAISTTNGNLASLTTRVGSAEGSISTLQSSVTTLDGTVSTLSSTVSSQGGSITSLQSAVSSNGSNLATLTTRVDAGAGVNLVPNGGFENGMTGWTTNYGGWNPHTSGSWGRITGNSSLGDLGGGTHALIESARMNVWQGMAHTLSMEIALFATDPQAHAYSEILWYNSADAYISTSYGPTVGRGDFSTDNSRRRAFTFTAVSPVGTVYARVRAVVNRGTGTVSGFSVRQVKLETGSVATAWNSAASVVQQWQSFNDLNSSFSTLSTTVSSQGGSISTLQSSYTGLSGTVSTLSSTVSSQGGQISTLQSTVSTATGDISTLRTQVSAGGGNLLANTDLAASTAGWGFSTNDGATGDRVANGDNWIVLGENGLRINQANGNTGGFSEWDQYLVLQGGAWYDASVLAAAHRCSVTLYMQFYDASGAALVAPQSDTATNISGGHYVKDWARLSVKYQAPTNAVRARIVLRKFSTSAGQSDSFAWFCRPQIAETRETSASPLAYSPGSARTVIETQAQAISTAEGNIASLTSRVGTAESNISTNATAISTTNGNLASLTTRVGTAEGSITSLSSSYSSLNGTVSTLSSTVSTQGSSISTLQSAVSTAQGNLATLTTRVDAGAGVNLVVNGGFENGMTGWGPTHSGWEPHVSGSWGQIAYNSSLGNLGGGTHTWVQSDRMNAWGGLYHTMSFEVSLFATDPTAHSYGEILWYDSADNYVSTSYGPAISTGDFSPDNSRRRAFTFTVVSPAGISYARVRVTTNRGNGSITSLGIRQVKLETGSSATAWNSAASVVQQWKSFNDLNSSFSSLSTTVSSQGGSISTLQSSYTTLNGTVSSLSSTVSSQGGAISSLQSATSTATGDIATLKTQISAGAGNLLQNTDFATGVAWWGYWHNGTGSFNQGRDLLGDTWRPEGEHVYVLAQDDATPGYYASFFGQKVPIDPAKWYEWSAYLAAHRCPSNLAVEFYNSSDVYMQTVYSATAPQQSGGKVLADYYRSFFKAKPPAGSAYARVIFEKHGTNSGGNSYLFILRPQMKEVFETAASPAAYTIGGAGATIVQQATTLATLTTSYSSLETRVSSAEGGVSSLQSSMTSANGSISSLQSSVSSLNGSVSTLQSSSSTQAGQISALQSTVSTQGASIATNSQAITSLSGSVSSLNTIVTASSNPNLVPNGGFENGLRGWTGGGALAANWQRYTWAWGNYADPGSGFTGGGSGNYAYLTSAEFPVASGPNQHSQSFDYEMSGGAGCLVYGEMVWFDSNHAFIMQTGTPQSGPKGFDTTGNSRVKFAHTPPNNASYAQARVVFYAPNGVTMTGLRFRQMKVELGSVSTPYSGEATAAQMFTAYSDLNSSHASLSSTVSSQGGSISTLQSTTSTLSGTVSSLSSTVSSQGGSISTLQSVQSTHAGQIATLNNRVTLGGNLLQNTEFGADASGWGFYSHNGGNTGFEWGRDLPSDNWYPTNEHVLTIHQLDQWNDRAAQWFSAHVPVIGGRWYEGSVYAATHRCYSDLRIEWYDGSGNSISGVWSQRMDSFPGFYQTNGGRSIGNYTRMWVKAQAPAGAARALLNWVKHGTSQDGAWNGATDSWGWMCRPQLAEVYAETQSPTSYFPGKTGLVIQQQATAISTLNSQYSSLSSTVATQGSLIGQNATAISTTNGTLATLQSTVSSQGSSISSLQSTVSTIQGDAATLKTRVDAGSKPNLIKNGGFENGMANWGMTHGGWVAGNNGSWGHTTTNYTLGTLGGAQHTFIETENIRVYGTWHTVSFETVLFLHDGEDPSVSTYAEIIWYDGSGNYVGQSEPLGVRNGQHDFSTNNEGRRQGSALVPSNASFARARVVCYRGSKNINVFGVKQVKLEAGTVATPYNTQASVVQTFETLSTLNSQYASLNSTVSTLNSSVSTQQAAINNLNGKTAAWLEMTAVAGNGRAQLKLHADANGGGGVDIVGDVRISGDTMIAGTLSVSALNYGLFVRRGIANVSGTPSAGQTLTLHNQNIGQCQGFGSYSINVSGSFQTNVSYVTSTHNGKPLYTNYVDDGGLIVRLIKNGVTVAEMAWSTDTLNLSSSNMRTVYITNAGKLVEVTDGVAADVYLQVLAIRGNQDTGIVDQGDYYSRTVSASYQSFGANVVGKWTFV